MNIPHASIEGIAESGWQQGKSFFSKVREWTDWYTDYLFWSNQKQIIPVRFDLSRFIVDVERLENDPLDAIGQGILYKKFVDCERTSNLTSQSILIDCHSFPSVLSDIDICICPFKYHSIMIEINKRIYMNELSLELSDNAENVKSIVSRIYNKLLMYGN